MKIDEELIKKLEKLARLDLTVEEKEIIQNDLENILDMVNKIQEFDTSNVDPLRYINDDINQLRDDIAQPGLTEEDRFRNAAKHKDGFFEVPKVIDIKKK